MSKTLKNIKIPYWTEGTIRSAQLNDTIAPENSVQLALNMNFDRVGALTTRGGVATYATTLAGSAKAFGTLNVQGGVKRLFAQVGTTIYVWDGANWTSVRTVTGSGKARFSQYLNRTWMVNGNGGSTPATSGGSTFDTTNVPGTLPAGDFIQAGFDGRVWIADKATDVVYYTDIVQFTPPSTYSLTFDLSTNFIKTFSPQDGESITGLFRVPRALLLFKENHIYRIYSASNVDPYPAYNVGTFSQESIVQAKDGLYFHHSSGFYKFAYDGQPIEISRRVIDFVKAIPRSSYADISGVWDGFDNIEWAVGSVTVEGVTYGSCVMRYSISTQVWTIYDYTGNTITSMIRYDDGTTIESLIGTSAGKVGKLNSGNDDFGSDIYVEFIDRWRSFTEMYSKSKSISGVTIISQNAGGLRLEYQHEKSPANVWEYLDTVNSQYDALMPNATTEDFANVRLRLVGNSKGTPIVIHGIELLAIQDKGFENN
jgi:hypothetical protein